MANPIHKIFKKSLNLQSMSVWIANPANRTGQLLSANRKIQISVYVILAIIFTSGLVFSINRAPGLLTQLKIWPLLVVALFGMPFTVILNAANLRVCGRIVSNVQPFITSLRITVASMAANLLPIPGSLVVRAGALKSDKSRYKNIAILLFGTSALWIAASCLAVSGIIAFRHSLMSLGLLIIGLILFTVFVASMRQNHANLTDFRDLVAIQAGMLLITATRMWLCLIALGIYIEWTDSFVFSLAPALGSAFGFAPGGIGIREWTTAGLAPLIGVLPAAGFLAAVANRIAGMAALSVIAIFFSIGTLRTNRSERQLHDDQ